MFRPGVASRIGSVTHLSIIIPANGPQAAIDDTLVSVLENRPASCEVLLVHAEEYVDPYDLADEVQLVSASTDDLLELWNAGLERSRGEVINTLQPGITVADGWCEHALEQFADNRNLGAVAPCIVAKRNRKTIQGIKYHPRLGKKIVRSSRGRILAPLLGTGFYRASAMRFMRGFDQRFGVYADVELGMRMQSARYESSKCDSRIQSESPLAFKSVRGFRGGKLRGELFTVARQQGMASSLDGLISLLGEMTPQAMLGRLFVKLQRPQRPRTAEVVVHEKAQAQSDRPLRKAG